MEAVDKIKKIDIKQVLDAMWIKTNTRKWLWDFNENKFSDSYAYCIKDNIVTNFNKAKEWRPDWNPLNFYVQHTWSSVKEAIEWFDKSFWMHIEKIEYKKIEEVHQLTDDDRLSSYLFLRGINIKKLPKNTVSLVRAKTYWKHAPSWEGPCLSIPMKFIDGKLSWYQYRSLIAKWFYTNGNDALFYSFDKYLTWDYIILVEWATDYLTIRQYTQQVMWFKSASATPNEETIAFINKFDKIYLLLDNDPAGKKCKEWFREAIDANVYELESEKDPNELHKEQGSSILEYIFQSAHQTKEKIFALINYEEWLMRWYKELTDRVKESVMSWGFEKFDHHMGYLLPWQLVVVWGVTWVGKTTIVNQIANNVARQWFVVARYWLEDRLEETRINDIYYEVNRIRTKQNDKMPSHAVFEANLFTDMDFPWIAVDVETAVKNLKNYNKNIIDLAHKQMAGIKELENLFKDVVMNKWASLVVIDHLHYVKFEKNERHDLAIESFMHQLNDLLRKYKVTCILVSHYRKLQKDEEPDNNAFKDWAAIAQVANKVIHIDNDKTEVAENIPEWEWKAVRYIITKNRWKSWLWIIFWRFHNGRIIMWESTLSKERRNAKRLWYNQK